MRLRAFALLGAVVLGGYASSSDKIAMMGVQAPRPEQFVRSELETAAQLEYDMLRGQVFEHKAGSDEQRRAAMVRIKWILYNKSYINFKCLVAAIYDAQAARRQTVDDAKLEDCAKSLISQLYMNYKIWADYVKSTEPMVAKRCEMGVRLFDAELEFPPFDFLVKGELAELALFDFEKLNACVIGEGR
jgi:hypothetical protein